MSKKSTLLTLAAFAMAAMSEEQYPIDDREIVYQKEVVPDYERKKCKSCKLFNKVECNTKYIKPLSRACCKYERRK